MNATGAKVSELVAATADMMNVAVRGTEFMERCWRWSLRFDTCEPDHLAPLLGFIGDELSEVGWRAGKNLASQLGHACLHSGIGERRVNLFVEAIDDLGRGALRSANA